MNYNSFIHFQVVSDNGYNVKIFLIRQFSERIPIIFKRSDNVYKSDIQILMIKAAFQNFHESSPNYVSSFSLKL